MKIKPITGLNVDKVLNDIKRNKRNSKIIITNYKHWDILDGRTKKGKPFKKLAKVLDFGAYLISCATIAFIIGTVLTAWVG